MFWSMCDIDRQQLMIRLERARSAVGLHWPGNAARERLQDLADELARQGIEPSGLFEPRRIR